MGPLPPDGQTPTVSQAAIAADIHQAFDVHRGFGTKSAFNLESIIDYATELVDIIVRQILYPGIRIYGRLNKDSASRRAADSVDVRQRYFNTLSPGQIDSRNSGHSLALPLLMLRIATADYPHHSAAPNNLAMFTHPLHAGTYLHATLITFVRSRKSYLT